RWIGSVDFVNQLTSRRLEVSDGKHLGRLRAGALQRSRDHHPIDQAAARRRSCALCPSIWMTFTELSMTAAPTGCDISGATTAGSDAGGASIDARNVRPRSVID